MADSMNDLEPVVWERGDGKIFYQPRVGEWRLCLTAGWEKLTFVKLYRYDPRLYRSKKRAMRVAKRHAKALAKADLRVVREVSE